MPLLIGEDDMGKARCVVTGSKGHRDSNPWNANVPVPGTANNLFSPPKVVGFIQGLKVFK